MVHCVVPDLVERIKREQRYPPQWGATVARVVTRTYASSDPGLLEHLHVQCRPIEGAGHRRDASTWGGGGRN